MTAKVQQIVDNGERRFPAWRLGQGDDPALQTLKTLSVEYTLDGQPATRACTDGETMSLDDTPDPTPTAHLSRTADNQLVVEAWQDGHYKLKTASGKTLRCDVDGIPAAQPIEGPWELHFPPNTGAPDQIKLAKLISWGEHQDPGVKYFSGTAAYRTTFRISPDALAPGRSLYLDLGKVAVIARVKINDHDLGILWKAPFRLDATKALRAGDNRLEVQVTNLWVNRMIGDEQLPEDCQRDPNGQLTAWPKWLLENQPQPSGRYTFATYRVWKKDSPLQTSGLLGPAKLYTTQTAAPH